MEQSDGIILHISLTVTKTHHEYEEDEVQYDKDIYQLKNVDYKMTSKYKYILK